MGAKHLMSRATIGPDLLAGLTSALVYIPKGMAFALVAGINPIHGLYAGIVAPLVAALLTGSSFMVIVATNELAVPAGAILASESSALSVPTLLSLTFLIGAFQLAFGLLRLGSMVRFISESVMAGFVTGVAVLMILGQLGKLTGYHSEVSGNTLVQAWDWVTHLHRIDVATTAIGLATVAAIVVLQRTRASRIALILAIVFATALAALMGSSAVTLLGGSAQIPETLPTLLLPRWELIPGLIVPALSLAIVGLAVSAGISQSYVEPDGSLPDSSRDFTGQGVANLAAALFQGMPVGGSFSQTAVSVSAGAKTRAASVFLAILLGFAFLTIGDLVKLIPLAALAGLLIVIGFEMIKPQRLARVRGTHWSERLAMTLTFVSTLTIPIQYAILAGVVSTVCLYVYSSSVKIRIYEIASLADGRYEERPAPAEIPSNKTTILGVYGNAFFAAIYTLEHNLPSIENTKHAVIIFPMRGRDVVMSSFLAFLERYAKKVRAGGNRLVLCGVEPEVKKELERSGTIMVVGEENIFVATAVFGDSMTTAHAAADEWRQERIIRH